MIKRALMLLLALALLTAAVPCAGAEHQSAADMPYELKKALQGSVFAQDEVLDWILHSDPYTASALVAVKHEGKSVLVGYQAMDALYRQAVLSDTLLPQNGDFHFEYHRHGDKDTLSVAYRGQHLCLMPLSVQDGWLPYLYHASRADGSSWELGLYGLPEELPYTATGSDGTVERGELGVVLPGDASMYTFDMFPQSVAKGEKWPAALTLPPDKKYAVCAGCNFRALPDVRSTSKGYYAPGTVIELGPMRVGNWQLVYLGGETGWMHVNYVEGPERFLSYVLPVARLREETPLLDESGHELQLLPAGAVMHVLGYVYDDETRPDQARVCVPQGDIAQQMDPSGLYGYIDTTKTDLYPSALDLKYSR